MFPAFEVCTGASSSSDALEVAAPCLASLGVFGGRALGAQELSSRESGLADFAYLRGGRALLWWAIASRAL
eukprot:4711769-Heterocapsa_arctica.AAC.1